MPSTFTEGGVSQKAGRRKTPGFFVFKRRFPFTNPHSQIGHGVGVPFLTGKGV